jgi:hypothetical protein
MALRRERGADGVTPDAFDSASGEVHEQVLQESGWSNGVTAG